MRIEEMNDTVRETAATIRNAHTSAGYPRMRIDEMNDTVREIAAGISLIRPSP